MENRRPGEITSLLLAWRNGEQEALQSLMPLVYNELRHIAKQQFQRYGLNGDFQPTALVHEAYLKLIDQTKVQWQDRTHFYAIVAKTFRQILIMDYRNRSAKKRGGNISRYLLLDDIDVSTSIDTVDLLALNEALEKLAILDERQARIVELRYFGGLSNKEIMEVEGVSQATVERELQSARAWLYTQLTYS
ncbi:MAG: sigma-70 family RNA polymerase sigma factor [Acidobacteriota bacterium]